MASGELRNRLLVAIIGVPSLTYVLYLGGWTLTAVVAVGALVGTNEVYRMAAERGVRPFVALGTAASVVYVLLAGAVPEFGAFASGFVVTTLITTLLALGLAVFRRWPEGGPMSSVTSTLFGAVYVGGALSFTVLLRHLPETVDTFPQARAFDGAMLVVFAVAVTWMGDSAAFFFGRAWGKTKLVPRISPGKTRVGSMAGLLTSALTGVVLADLFLVTLRYVSIGPILGGVIGLLLGFFGQLGDLCESILKREAGVKDSGRFLPGHGGALDRVDALLFTLPITYFILMLLWWTT